MKNKILLIQPGYAHYRNQLFEILATRHNIHILYINKDNVYPGAVVPGEYSHSFLEKSYYNKPVSLLLYLVRNKPDIVISSISTSYYSIISYLYAFLFKKKFILWIIEWRAHPNKKSFIKNFMRKYRYLFGRKMIQNCHALIAGGSASKKYAKSLGKGKNEIFLAIQCSNDLSLLLDGKVDKKNNIKNINFLYLSRVVPHKGLDILINAFSVLEREEVDVSLTIGGDGEFLNHCKKIAIEKGTKNIHFIGPVIPDQLGKIFSLADVFVFPWHYSDIIYESWGLVINEAMSMGLPVITTNATGATFDYVKHQLNGLIVRENSESDLYKAMRHIFNSDLSSMQQNARNTFEKLNKPEKMADGFSEAIKYVMKSCKQS